MRNDRSGRSLLPERTVFGRSFLPERTFAERRTVGWTFLSVVWPISSIDAQDFPHQHLLVRGVFRGADLGHECPRYRKYWQVRDELQHGGRR